MSSKCLICKREIPPTECCLGGKVDGEFVEVCLGCEPKLHDFLKDRRKGKEAPENEYPDTDCRKCGAKMPDMGTRFEGVQCGGGCWVTGFLCSKCGHQNDFKRRKKKGE